MNNDNSSKCVMEGCTLTTPHLHNQPSNIQVIISNESTVHLDQQPRNKKSLKYFFHSNIPVNKTIKKKSSFEPSIQFNIDKSIGSTFSFQHIDRPWRNPGLIYPNIRFISSRKWF